MRMKESGLADIWIGGKGLDLLIDFSFDKNVFKVSKVKARLDKVRVHLFNTRHDGYYKLLKPLINSRVKTYIRKSVESGVSDLLFKFERQIGYLGGRFGLFKV
jgi:hypothetical protein